MAAVKTAVIVRTTRMMEKYQALISDTGYGEVQRKVIYSLTRYREAVIDVSKEEHEGHEIQEEEQAKKYYDHEIK